MENDIKDERLNILSEELEKAETIVRDLERERDEAL